MHIDVLRTMPVRLLKYAPVNALSQVGHKAPDVDMDTLHQMREMC